MLLLLLLLLLLQLQQKEEPIFLSFFLSFSVFVHQGGKKGFVGSIKTKHKSLSDTKIKELIREEEEEEIAMTFFQKELMSCDNNSFIS
jgi:hypothetical protein